MTVGSKTCAFRRCPDCGKAYQGRLEPLCANCYMDRVRDDLPADDGACCDETPDEGAYYGDAELRGPSLVVAWCAGLTLAVAGLAVLWLFVLRWAGVSS